MMSSLILWPCTFRKDVSLPMSPMAKGCSGSVFLRMLTMFAPLIWRLALTAGGYRTAT